MANVWTEVVKQLNIERNDRSFKLFSIDNPGEDDSDLVASIEFEGKGINLTRGDVSIIIEYLNEVSKR